MSGFIKGDAPSASALDAVDVAIPLASAAGASPDSLQAVQSARQGVGLAEAAAAGDGMALAQGAVGIAAQHNPEVAKLAAAAQTAGQVAGLAQSFAGLGQKPSAQALGLGPVSGIAGPVSAPALDIDDDPRNGFAIADHATPPGGKTATAAPDTGAISDMITGPDALSRNQFGALAKIANSNRLLRMEPIHAAKKAVVEQLFIAAIEGTAALSRPYQYELELISLNASISLKDVLAVYVGVYIRLADGNEHCITGILQDFAFERSDGGLAYYKATLVPWTTVMGLRTNSRIFQDITVLEAVERVLAEYGELRQPHEARVFGELPKLNYLVQYNETDLDFFHRVLAQAGLFYYFEHDAKGHTLVICDDSTRPQCCPPQAVHTRPRFNDGQHVDDQDNITSLSARRLLQPNAVALNTFDFKQPSSPRYLEVPGVADQGEVPRLEQYDGNPAFAYRDIADGNREARLRLELLEWQAKVFTAGSECRAMTVGRTFMLQEHFWFKDDDDADLLVIGQTLRARNNFDDNIGTSHAEAGSYHSTLTLIRRKIPFRPLRDTPKPVMKGLQTATVVGPKGMEIHTDAFGRIKVQFPWDREGRYNEASSCWIRVSQPWAGKGWGTVAIPRVGQEVLIDFMEGDPDRPVCMGRMFNAEQTPPYALPDGAHQMGFKSRSTPGGGGFCEMVIHDQKGQELINIHSQKDMNITVQDTETHTVKKGNRSVTLEVGDESKTISQGNLFESIAQMLSTNANVVQVKAAAGKAGPGTQLYEASDQIVHRVGGSSLTLLPNKIELKIGGSTLTMTEAGIFLDGPVIHLNK